MRRTATRCTSATCSTATACARGSARRSGSPTARRRSRSSICSRPRQPNAPINVFIHGGAWRAAHGQGLCLPRRDVRATPARTSSALDFVGVEGTKGDLLPMADQVRRAVAWVYKNAKSFGGDPDRIYVVRPVVRRASRRQRRHHRLEGLRRAGRRREGRAALLGHVRPQAGAAVEALGVRRLHRRESRRSCPRSAISTGSTAR